MKAFFSVLVLLTSLSVFAETIVPTKGKELHLVCVMSSEAFFIQIDSAHQKAKLFQEDRTELITNLELNTLVDSDDAQELYFIGQATNKNIRGISVTIPYSMDLYFGAKNMSAHLDVYVGTDLSGSCYVQFPAMPPQW